MLLDNAACDIKSHTKVHIRSTAFICFLALVIYRYLERDLGNAFSYEAILDKLRTMNFANIQEQGFIPLYTRDKLTNALHTICGFETNYELPLAFQRNGNGICRRTPKSRLTRLLSL